MRYLWALVLLLAGCAAHRLQVAAPAAPGPIEPGYIDLEPGWRLRVVTPILESGGYRFAPCKDAVVVIQNERVSVNGNDMGALHPQDTIVVDKGQARIHGINP